MHRYLLSLSLIVFLGAAGCGCSYAAEDLMVAMSPASDCLIPSARAECPSVSMSIDNQCAEDLIIHPVEGASTERTVAANSGATLSHADLGELATAVADEDNCYVTFTIEAELGSQPVTFVFVATRVNRGLAKPCE